MKMSTKFSWILIMIFFISFLNSSEKPLEIKINETIALMNQQGYNLQLKEDTILKLLDEYTSAEEQGKIYYTIIDIYSNKFDYKNIIKYYCNKALEYPLSLDQKLSIYNDYGFAYTCKLLTKSIKPLIYKYDEDCINSRKEAAKIWIEGLNLIKDYNLPTNRQIIPKENIIVSAGTMRVWNPSSRA